MKILLCNYDNGSRWPVLPLNLIILKDALASAGHSVEIEDFNVTKKFYSSIIHQDYDVIGLGFISGYWQHKQAVEFAEAIEPVRREFKFVIGGHGPSAAPQYYKKLLGADAVFRSAAERSFPAWIDDGCPDGIFDSKGYLKAPFGVSRLPRHQIDVYKRISFPNTKPHEFALQVLSGRGCPYKCAFCYRPDKTFFQYDIHHLAEQIEGLICYHNIRHFQFADELLMSNDGYIQGLCEALIRIQEKYDHCLGFDCNGRLNRATKENLSMMYRAGFRYINYGCESMSDKVLENINKHQTVDDIEQGIRETRAQGISPGINLMWGNPGDDLDTLEAAKQFILKYSDNCELRTIRPVTPYPGTPLFQRLIDDGWLDSNNPVADFYEWHTNSDLFSFNFMDMDNGDADKALFQANCDIIQEYAAEKGWRQIRSMLNVIEGWADPASFRGYREI